MNLKMLYMECVQMSVVIMEVMMPELEECIEIEN
jgi:hypothetical protein